MWTQNFLKKKNIWFKYYLASSICSVSCVQLPTTYHQDTAGLPPAPTSRTSLCDALFSSGYPFQPEGSFLFCFVIWQTWTKHLGKKFCTKDKNNVGKWMFFQMVRHMVDGTRANQFGWVGWGVYLSKPTRQNGPFRWSSQSKKDKEVER